MTEQLGGFGSLSFKIMNTGRWSLIDLFITPLVFKSVGEDTTMTSINDLELSVILVGDLMICWKFNSWQVF